MRAAISVLALVITVASTCPASAASLTRDEEALKSQMRVECTVGVDQMIGRSDLDEQTRREMGQKFVVYLTVELAKHPSQFKELLPCGKNVVSALKAAHLDDGLDERVKAALVHNGFNTESGGPD